MKIAAVQMDVSLGDLGGNFERIAKCARTSAAAGSRLTILPELSLTGYCFDSLEEMRGSATSIPGPFTERIIDLARETDQHLIVGLLEADGSHIYNSAILAGPDRLVGSYRKSHLPYIGADRFATSGQELSPVFDVEGLRVGINICYDATLPEPGRCLALAGADLVALPTNWPEGADAVADHVPNTRAMENGVYYAAANRVGVERGCPFIGGSRICGPAGETLAAADRKEETILYAEVDPTRARAKRVIRNGNDALDRVADRRPELYSSLTRPHGRTPPGREGVSQ